MGLLRRFQKRRGFSSIFTRYATDVCTTNTLKEPLDTFPTRVPTAVAPGSPRPQRVPGPVTRTQPQSSADQRGCDRDPFCLLPESLRNSCFSSTPRTFSPSPGTSLPRSPCRCLVHFPSGLCSNIAQSQGISEHTLILPPRLALPRNSHQPMPCTPRAQELSAGTSWETLVPPSPRCPEGMGQVAWSRCVPL